MKTFSALFGQKNKRNIDFSMFLSHNYNAGDRNRTGTVLLQQDFKSCASASSATPAYHTRLLKYDRWAEVDSNHRSNLQQIYSLSPLATRESTHFVCSIVLTRNDYNTAFSNTQAFFARISRRKYKKECDKLACLHSLFCI